MRIVSGGRWTGNGRWVVVNDDNAIVFDSPGLYGDGYDLREREIKMHGDGPHIDWAEEPDMKGEGEFSPGDAICNLAECWDYVEAQGRLAQR